MAFASNRSTQILVALALPWTLGCAQTTEYFKDTASHRTGTGVGMVVGDKAVAEADKVINPRDRPAGQSQSPEGAPGGGRVVRSSASGGSASGGGDDACTRDPHCLAPDELLVCGQDIADYSPTGCAVAHVLTQPSAGTKQQGHFLLKNNGRDLWSDGWMRTRPVKDGENLKIGQTVVYLDEGTAPKSHQHAIGLRWRIGKITDLSDAFKGAFRSSHNQHPQLAQTRVIIDSGWGDRVK